VRPPNATPGKEEAVKRTLGWVLCTFAAGVVAGALIVHGQTPDWDPDRRLVPGVRCLDSVQDLGTVYLTDALGLAFRLVNDSPDEAFRLDPIRGGCSCTAVAPEELMLAPGETATVRATVDLEQYRFEEGEEPWEFDETVTAYVHDPYGEDYPLRMRAHGLARQSYRIAPDTVGFGMVIRGDSPQRSVVVESLMPGAEGLEVVSAPTWLEARVVRGAAGAKETQIGLSVRPDPAYGRLAGAVRFRAVPASQGFATRTVAAWTVVRDDIQALPSSLVFVVKEAEWLPAQVVTLQSSRGEWLEVMAVENTGSQILVHERGSDATGVHRYAVEIVPGAGQPIEGSVRFAVKTASGRRHVIEVPVRAYALSAGG
jgi:hypothetical protein